MTFGPPKLSLILQDYKAMFYSILTTFKQILPEATKEGIVCTLVYMHPLNTKVDFNIGISFMHEQDKQGVTDDTETYEMGATFSKNIFLYLSQEFMAVPRLL